MNLYDHIIEQFNDLHDQWSQAGLVRDLNDTGPVNWPGGNGRNLVLGSETGLELGNPRDESVTLHLWTQDPSLVRDGRISLMGPDVGQAQTDRLPFGKVVLVGGTGFDQENAYPRYRELSMARFDVSLEGYMLRATSQYMRQWCRISCQAVDNGFSLGNVGRALARCINSIDYVSSVEIFFVTTGSKAFAALKPLALRVDKINSAMNKMSQEMSLDCSECEFDEICSDVDELRRMRKTLADQGKR